MSFKVRLLLGAAVPLAFALPAAAQVQITNERTTAIATANANTDGTAANIEITSSGSVKLDETPNASAVTINSNNTVTNSGAIAVTDSNGAVGVRITAGVTGGYTGAAGSTIAITEDYTRTDTDDDDDLDGPIAQGSNRFGILVEPGGTFTGNILLNAGTTSASSITVEGNDSAGVSIQSALVGDYRQKGVINLFGSNGVGVDLREDVTGNIAIGGSTVVQGENSVGVRSLGDVNGEFMIDGTVSATGFTSTAAIDSDYRDPDFADDNDEGSDEPAKLDPDDLLAGGPAVQIRGDLSRGLLVNGNAVGGTDPTDDVKDVIQDFNENRSAGTISSIGSAPALLIQSADGAAGGELRLGLVRETIRDTLDDDDDDDVDEVIGTFDYEYGLINRGTISAAGFNKGFEATGARIAGSADGQHQTIVEGGIFNGGQITAAGREANATALNIGSGASTPQLVNNGSIIASVETQTTHTPIGIRIDAGANLPTVINNGNLGATADSFDADVIAFQDLSGTVTSFRNTSRIVANQSDDLPADDITSGTGRKIALDLSHGSSGVTLTQTDAVDNARIIGDVLFGAGSDRFDLLSGEVHGKVDFGTGSDTLQINSARLFGDATFGGANANVSLTGSEMQGAIALGNAASTLSFTGKSIYSGAITGTGAISLAVDDSTVNNNAAGTLNLTSMTLTNNAKVGFVINNARVAANTPIFNITGAANIDANTVFTPIFEEFTNQTFTLRVLDAATLNLGGPAASMLNAASPYIYDVQLVQPNANALDLVLRVKTSEELGLNTRQAGAYSALLNLLEEDSTVAAAVTSLGTMNEFLRGYSDLMPGNDAAVMKMLATNATAAFGATAHRLDLISDKPDAPGGAWVEQFGVYHRGGATADGLAVSGGGFGVAAGLDLLSNGNALIGGYASIESVETDEHSRTSGVLNVAHTSLGAYGGWRAGQFEINAAGGVGFANFSSTRKIAVAGLQDTATAEWDALSYNFGARALYNIPMGFIDVKPFIAADYFSLNEDGYEESVPTFDGVGLIAGEGESTLATASYGVTFVGNFGSDSAFSFRPELTAGYRNVLEWKAPEASYQFAGNTPGTTFQLAPGQDVEDGFVAGLGLNVDSQFLNIKLNYDIGISDNSTTHYGAITLRLAFW